MHRRHHAWITALSLCLSPIDARAAAVLAPPALPTPQPYLKTCEGILEALGWDGVEAYFLNQAATPGERMQLLLDYGFLFTSDFAEALRSAESLQDIDHWPVGRVLRTLRALRADPLAMRALAEHVFDRSAGREGDSSSHTEDTVHAQRRRRFVEAARARSDWDEYVTIMVATIDLTLIQTMDVARAMRVHRVRASPILAIGLLSSAVGAFGTGVSSLFIFHSVEAFLGGGASCVVILGSALAVLSEETPQKAALRNNKKYGRSYVSGRTEYGSMAMRDRSDDLPSASKLPRLTSFDARGIAKFTPVELAHVGRVEVAELLTPLPSPTTALREAWTELPPMEAAARRVLDQAADVRGQLVFASAVEVAGEAADAAIKAFDEGLAAKRRDLAELVRCVDDLEQSCFVKLPADATEADLLGREILIARSRHDLPRLREIVISGGFEAEIVDLARPLVEALAQTIRSRPRTPEEWRSAAARAIDLATDLRKITEKP